MRFPNSCASTTDRSPTCTPNRAVLEWDSTNGQEYGLFIRGRDGAAGDFQLTVTSP